MVAPVSAAPIQPRLPITTENYRHLKLGSLALHYSGYALDGNLARPVGELLLQALVNSGRGEAVVKLAGYLTDDLLLAMYHRRELGVDDLGVQFAAHERRSLVVLDEAIVGSLGQADGLREALLAKVAHGKLVGVGEEEVDAHAHVVVLQVVHQVGAVALDLLVGRHGTKHDFREALGGERAETNAANHLTIASDVKLPLNLHYDVCRTWFAFISAKFRCFGSKTSLAM